MVPNWTAATGGAELRGANGIASDGAGTVYVADSGNRRVRRFTGGAVGPLVEDTSYMPTHPYVVDEITVASISDVSVSADGRVFAVDAWNKRVITASPQSAEWSVFCSLADAKTLAGMDVSQDGTTAYVADPNAHVIWKCGAGTGAIGTEGRELGAFMGPRDVAVLPDGRLIVADAGNHRIVLIDQSGGHSLLARTPLVESPHRLAWSERGLFVADTSRGGLVFALLPGEPGVKDMGLYVRDHLQDHGQEPSLDDTPDPDYPELRVVYSPDILMRLQPDVDTQAALQYNGGIPRFVAANQDPNNHSEAYVYVAVHNGGASPVHGAILQLYELPNGLDAVYPADYATDSFSQGSNLAAFGNLIRIPPVPAAAGGRPGSVVVGPIKYLHDGSLGPYEDRVVRIAVRLQQPGHSIPDLGEDEFWASNKTTFRVVRVIGDGYWGDPTDVIVELRCQRDRELLRDDLPSVHDRVKHVRSWIERETQGREVPRFTFRGPLVTKWNYDYYHDSRSSLVELASEVIGTLKAVEPELLAPGPEGKRSPRVWICGPCASTNAVAGPGGIVYGHAAGTVLAPGVAVLSADFPESEWSFAAGHLLGYPFTGAGDWDIMSTEERARGYAGLLRHRHVQGTLQDQLLMLSLTAEGETKADVHA